MIENKGNVKRDERARNEKPKRKKETKKKKKKRRTYVRPPLYYVLVPLFHSTRIPS